MTVPAWRQFFKDGEVRHAEFPITARRSSTDAERTTYEVAFSSEAEVIRWFGIEILGHDKGEVDLSRLNNGGAVLMDHDRSDLVGVVEKNTARVDKDHVARASVRFSSSVRGKEIERDVEDEIRQLVSVGYSVKAAKLVETRTVGKDDSGRAITVDVWRVTEWQPMEISLVSVPADVEVGVGRSENAGPNAAPIKGDSPTEGTMKKVRGEKGEVVEVADDDPRPAITARAQVTAAERDKQTAEILDLAEGHNVPMKDVRAWIDEGLGVEAVAARILDSKKSKPVTQPAAETLDVPKKDAKRYSYARAILKAAMQREGTGKFDGIEAELSNEIDKRLDATIPRHGGIFVPVDLRSDEDRQRALDSKTVTKGPELIQEEHGELIEILRQKTVLSRLGARFLTGLTAPVSFPKQTGRLTAYWVGENPAVDVPESDLAFGTVNLIPKTMQATTSYSRQLLVQTSFDVEGMVKSELGEEHSLLLDRTAFHGEGTGNEPTGLYKTPDVNVVAVGGVPDFADVINTIAAVLDDNANYGNLGWALTPLMAARLRQILEFPTAPGGRPLWEGSFEDGVLGSYRAIATNQMSKTMTGSEDTGGVEHGAIYGNWSQLLIGMFLGLEIIVDPYAKKKRGMIEVTSIQMADIAVRHGESFAKWTGALAA